MKIVKGIALLLTVAIIMIGVCGCMKTNKSEEKVVLTERQIRILEEKGLPSDYCQLTARQQMTIVDIEEMLQAVESKYGRSFVYVGYTAEKQLESGILTAKPDESDNARNMFTVGRCGDKEFVDTYVHVLVRNLYENKVREMLSGVVEDSEFKLYSAVLETNIKFEELSNDSLSNRVKADNWIFLEGSKDQDINLACVSDDIKALLSEAELYGSVYIVVVYSDCFELITQDNYTDFLSDEYVIKREFSNITEK